MDEHETSVSPGEIETGTAGRACEACHKKKTKCDMQQPVCGLCRRTNKECHFPTTRKRPSRQEPSVRAKLQKVNGNLDRLVELLEANPNIDQESVKGMLNTDATTKKQTSPKSKHAPTTKLSLSPPRNPFIPTSAVGIARSLPFPVDRELAIHLIDLYFDWIQPWLPLLHRPHFTEWSRSVLSNGDDCLANVTPNEAVLFNSIFALSGRYSNHHSLASLQPKEKGEKFMRAAEYWFRIARDLEEFDISHLKACTLLAFYHYVSGLSKRGWYLSHMCIRACYELGLHQIDDGDDDDQPEDAESWVEKESLRRLFWAIFEIDSFGSIIKRKPFAIDWRHIQVKMPISDEAWFAGRKVDSPKFMSGPECWKTLVGSPNQDERAWTLLSKTIIGYVFDLTLFKDGITPEQLSTMENNMSCFKLAMPETLQITSPAWTTAGLSIARKSWIIATNLYLAAGSFILTRIPLLGQPPTPREEAYSKEVAAWSNRVSELNEILKRWPTDSIPYTHPCIACTILTYDESLINMLPPSPQSNAYRDLSGLILSKIAEKWNIGTVLIKVRDLAHNYHTSDEETRADLVRQYPVYFDRELRKARKSIVEESHKIWTYNSPPTSIPTGNSAEQSLSPEQMSQQHLQLQSSPQSPQQQKELPQQHFQPQPVQLLSPPTDYMSSGFLDPMYSQNTGFNDGNNQPFPNYNAYPNTGQNPNPSSNPNPDDIDQLFSGFLQEPWWQDFSSVNFVV